MIRLSEISVHSDSELRREGAFKSLGFVTHVSDQMLVFLESANFLPDLLSNSRISCVITSDAMAKEIPSNLGLLIAANPRLSFYQLHNYLALETDFYWKPFSSRIAGSAAIHSSAVIAEGDVEIGENVSIGPNVTIMGHVTIENGAQVGPGSVLGSAGFQTFLQNAKPVRVVHAGSVRVGSDVDLHANICVDRALFGGVTTVGRDSVIDNLVYIAHDVTIGPGCRVGAGTQITGSVRIGQGVWIGPGATISNDVRIGDHAAVSLGSVVTKDVAAGTRVSGNFAVPHDRFLDHLRRIR